MGYTTETIFENVAFMRRIVQCLEGKLTENETNQVIEQLKSRIAEEKSAVQRKHTHVEPMMVFQYGKVTEAEINKISKKFTP